MERRFAAAKQEFDGEIMKSNNREKNTCGYCQLITVLNTYLVDASTLLACCYANGVRIAQVDNYYQSRRVLAVAVG